MGVGICPLVRVLIFYGLENRKKKKRSRDHDCDFFVVSYCHASFKRENNVQQKSEREEELGEKKKEREKRKGRSDGSGAKPKLTKMSRCPQLQAGFGPGNKATLPNSSEYHFCLHLDAFFSFVHSVNS